MIIVQGRTVDELFEAYPFMKMFRSELSDIVGSGGALWDATNVNRYVGSAMVIAGEPVTIAAFKRLAERAEKRGHINGGG